MEKGPSINPEGFGRPNYFAKPGEHGGWIHVSRVNDEMMK